MAVIQIRHVPDDVYETIKRRAHEAGQSVQAYMLGRITEMSRRPTPSEVRARLQAQRKDRVPLEVDAELLLRDLDRGRP